MAGSPFSLVLGHDQDSGTFTDVLTTQVGDTTTETNVASTDSGTESSVPVEVAADHSVHEAGQDETAAQSDTSGSPGYLT